MPRKTRRSPSRKSSRRKSSGGLLGFCRRYWKWSLLPLAFAIAGLFYVDYLVRSKFEGKKWSLPARVYARPLELYEGLLLKRGALEDELRALGYQFAVASSRPGQVSSEGDWLHIYSRGFDFGDRREPAQRISLRFAGGRIAELQKPGGQDLPILRLEPQEIGGIYPAHMEDRLLVRLQDIPPLLGEALIAVEDRDFRHHHGISLKAIARAAVANLRAGRVVQGGSTITQQLVKNFYLNHERSLWRKGIEALMALSLDARYSKAEILETYLNEVYLGQSGARAIHGFALASQHYFRQPLRELKVHQIALLVGVVKGASYYNPWRHPERATARRNLVLKIMHETGLISDFDLHIGSRQPLDVVQGGADELYTFPAFIDLVKEQLQRDYRAEDLRSEGLRIFTTLSPTVQKVAEASLARKLDALETRYDLEADSLQGAVVVEAVGSGEILAVLGDRDGRYQGFNRALNTRRAIGSLVKPAVYLAALSQPEHYTLITTLDDSPIQVDVGENRIWEPRNFSRQAHGEVPLYEALAKSYNQATARLGVTVGLDQVLTTLESLGLEADIPALPAVLLGAVDLSPLQVSKMYQTIASEGVFVEQRAILAVLDAKGQPLNRYPLRSASRFEPQVMHLLHYALQHTMREGTGRSAYQQLDPQLQLAGKSGTSNEQRDSWFAGFSADHLAVVWVGRDDNGPTPLTGASGALQVWADLFDQLSTRPLETIVPSGVDYHWVDPARGTLGGANCQGSQLMPFIAGSAPVEQGKCVYRQNPLVHWLKDLVNSASAPAGSAD